MECDVRTLLEQAKCFFCLDAREMEAIKAALLCDILAEAQEAVDYLESLPGD